jgi:uncharacterized protein YjiS (DUF1127 family)
MRTFGTITVPRWIARHRQRAHLAALTDADLLDIGVSREDADAEARKPFWK